MTTSKTTTFVLNDYVTEEELSVFPSYKVIEKFDEKECFIHSHNAPLGGIPWLLLPAIKVVVNGYFSRKQLKKMFRSHMVRGVKHSN